ncbi:MAG: hypothetical protein RMX68_031115 [Aulosira sp. ZfuVER01]|nr:hypothetical protein [Aulosira sp. ZfuVER01]MDZ7998279.1 hypothetical protein [Aulosira sp. DedVER01a]MDZ8050056.1 hypothetical protein [Aulosira sp. ZfuCHP01]
MTSFDFRLPILATLLCQYGWSVTPKYETIAAVQPAFKIAIA